MADNIKEMYEKARKAFEVVEFWDQERVDEVVATVAWQWMKKEVGDEVAKLAAEGSGMGKFEDKCHKAGKIRPIMWEMKNAKTCGIIAEDRDRGMVTYAKPIGVVANVVPTTNPSITAKFIGLSLLKTRNAMIKYLVCKNGYHEVPEYCSKAWMRVTNPTPKEIQFLIEKFEVPESFFSDIEDMEERPRVEYEDGWRMIIMRLPCKSEESENFFSTVPLGVLSNGDTFITVSHKHLEMIDDFILHSRRKSFQEKSNTDLILHLMLSAAVWFMKYLKVINLEIKDAEIQLQRSIRNEELLELMRIERTLVYFITSLRGNEILIQKLKILFKQKRMKHDSDLLEDVEIEMQQARTMANVYSDVLTGMMDAFAAVINNNVNVIMKRLTSISIVLMFPTLIASYFGMNVEAESQIWTFEFFMVIAVSVFISIIGVYFFKKKQWL